MPELLMQFLKVRPNPLVLTESIGTINLIFIILAP